MRFTKLESRIQRLASIAPRGLGLTMAILVAAALPASARAADPGPDAAPTLVLAALPAALDLAPTVVATPITPVQQQTCGCTPQGKQKILVIISGKEVCTATTLPCTAP